MLKNIKIIFFILIAISLNLCALNDLDKIRSNSIFVPSFTSTADQMVQEFAILLEVKLSTTREQIKSYIDAKMEGIDNKIDSLKKSSDSLSQGAKKEVSVIEQKINKLGQNLNSRLNVVAKTRRNVPVKAPARSRADDKIKEEVKHQLSFLREDRLGKIEKSSRRKKLARRKRLLRNLLEKELDDDFDA